MVGRDDAEELVQDTLVHLYSLWPRVAAADSQPAYVRRTVVNRFIIKRRSPAFRDASL